MKPFYSFIMLFFGISAVAFLTHCALLQQGTGSNSNGTQETAIVKLPFHSYYREIVYTIDDGRAIYEGDIDLGPINSLRLVSAANRQQFEDQQLRNGLLKLRANTSYPTLRQAQLNNPQPVAIPKSSILLDPEFKWVNGRVPYQIAGGFHPDTVLLIEGAMAFLENNTNVSFVERSSQSDYIRFIPCPQCNGSGSSPVGRQGNRQKIRIKEGVATQGNIVHEIMHSLGIYHTQSRPDRDSFICINLDNVLEGAEHNFDIHDGESYSAAYGAYNTNSFMHYGSCAFLASNVSCAGSTASVRSRNTNGTCSNALFNGNRNLNNFPASDIATINYLYGPGGNIGPGENLDINQSRTVTLYIHTLTTLVGPEENGLGCNDEMDFYATVDIGALEDIGEDPYQFSREERFTYPETEGNVIWPGWTAAFVLQPGERYAMMHIFVKDKDTSAPGGIGACGGNDDVVDVSPFDNMRALHLVLDTQTNELHLSRTTATSNGGTPTNPNNVTFSSTLNGVLANVSQAVDVNGNSSGEDHSARIRVMVAME